MFAFEFCFCYNTDVGDDIYDTRGSESYQFEDAYDDDSYDDSYDDIYDAYDDYYASSNSNFVNEVLYI